MAKGGRVNDQRITEDPKSRVRICALCGHKWKVKGSKNPKRCPNRGQWGRKPCASKRWRGGTEGRRLDMSGYKRKKDYEEEIEW